MCLRLIPSFKVSPHAVSKRSGNEEFTLRRHTCKLRLAKRPKFFAECTFLHVVIISDEPETDREPDRRSLPGIAALRPAVLRRCRGRCSGRVSETDGSADLAERYCSLALPSRGDLALDAVKTQRRRVKREQAVARSARWFVEAEVEGLDAQTAANAMRELPIHLREVIVAHLWAA